MSASQISLFEAKSERDRILDAIAERPEQRVYLGFVRPIAREIAARNGSVCIDDVREELKRRDLPMPHEVGLDARVFGALFRCGDFVAVEQRPTTRTAWAARVGRARCNVTVYRLVA